MKIRLGRLFELGHDLDWVAFEEFHMIFEELRCWAWHRLENSPAPTLGSWFRDGVFLNEGWGKTREVTIPTPRLVATKRLTPLVSLGFIVRISVCNLVIYFFFKINVHIMI